MAIFTLEYINEMKSKEEYSRESFKKKYKYEPSKDDKDVGTITDKDGKKYKVDISKKNKENESDLKTGEIKLNKNFFKLKGSNNNERRDAILNHEIGHTRLHNISADKENKSSKVFKDNLTKNAKDATKIDISNDNDIKLKYDNEIDPHDFRKQIYDSTGLKDYMKDLPDKKTRKEREKSYEKAKKYEIDNSHSKAAEFEADRYAANRTSNSAVKKGIRQITKLELKSAEKEYGKENIGSKESITKDINQRSKALNDKDLKKSDIYK